MTNKEQRKAKVKSFLEHIGRVIRRHRRMVGHSQENLGDSLRIKGPTVSRYEHGKSDIKASTMAEISEIYGFDLIEYALLNGESLSDKFRHLVNNSGKNPAAGISLESPADTGTRSVVYDMQYISMEGDRAIFSGIPADGLQNGNKRKRSEDILENEPNKQLLPLCDDDSRGFETYLYSASMAEKRRILIYGYELMKLYESIDSPWNTMEALARQLLRRIIREPSGGIDQTVYDYYWKCVYSNFMA